MPDRKVFTDSVTPLPDHPGAAPHGLLVNLAAPAAEPAEPMTILFSLDLPGDLKAELEAKVAAGEVVPRDQLAARFSPDKAKLDKLVDWLKAQGYEITEVAADNSGVYARADVATIENSLQVKMVPVLKDGITYTAAQNAPSLPTDIGDPVHAIVGLQPFRRAHRNFRRRFVTAANRGGLDASGTPSPNIANAPPYLCAEMLKAYGASALGLTGDGQTIAILIDTFPNDADLKAFWRANGLSITMAQVQKINVPGGTLPAPEGEETLDACWTSGIAPKAKIRIYASGSLEFSALDRALDRIIADLATQPTLNQLSISLGLGETFMGGPAGEVATQHQKFLKLAAAGVNVFVSTGDAGSNPDESGHNSGGPLQPEYESTDTAVIAVGGTSLRLKTTGAVQSETAWAGSGGGRSTLFPRPAWQVGAGLPAGHDRLVPDVCAAADPNTGAFLIVGGHAMGIGGTSWSAPMWAGFCALINEARKKKGLADLPYLNPSLYAAIGTTCFRDVTVGGNGAYQSKAGYDLVTGLGAPNVAALVQRLAP